MSYSSEVLTDSPYAYYRLNDASGNPADSSGNSRPATGVTGTPVYHTSGGPVSGGGYLTFDGSTEHVALGNIDDLATGQEFSFECWFRHTSTADMALCGVLNDGVSTAVQVKANRTDNDGGSDPGHITPYIRDSSGDSLSYQSTDDTLNDGDWHHLVVTWYKDDPGATGNWYQNIYIDGSLDRGPSSDLSNYVSLTTFGYDMYLGARNLRGSVSTLYAGDLAEVAFYQTELSSTRVAAHYAAATSTSVSLAPAVVEVAATVVDPVLAETLIALQPAVVEAVAPTVAVRVGARIDLAPAVVDLAGIPINVITAEGVNLQPAVVQIAAPRVIMPKIVDLAPAVVEITAPRAPRRLNIRAWTLDDFGSAAFGMEVQQEVDLRWGDPTAEAGWQPIRTNRVTWASIEVNTATGRPRTPTNVSVALDPAVVEVAAPALQF